MNAHIHFMCCKPPPPLVTIPSAYYTIVRYGKNEVCHRTRSTGWLSEKENILSIKTYFNIWLRILSCYVCHLICKFLALRHSSPMPWTIPGKSYFAIRHITFHKLRTYLRSHGQVLPCCTCLCWRACEKMHMTLFVVRDGVSRHSCPSPALAFQARAGFRHWSKNHWAMY